MKKFLFLFIIILNINCVYFNTFYNANYYYNKAIEPIENGLAPNTKYLDKAIEKCSKILQFYPESKYVDESLIIIGKSYMYKGEYTKAIRKFNELMKYYPESPYISEADFYLGKTYKMQGEKQLAELFFLKALNSNKKDMIYKSAEELIDMYLENKEIEKVDSIINIVLKNKASADIKFLKIKNYYDMQQYKDAYTLIKDIKFGHLSKINKFLYTVIYAELYAKLDSMTKSIKILDKGISIYKDDNHKNSLILKKAQILTEFGEYKKALAILNNILVQRGSIPIKDSLLFLRAEINEKYEKKYQLAIDDYNKIKTNHPNSELKTKAELKIMSLELLLSLDNNKEKNIEKIIKNKFLYAEINYLNLNNLQKAIDYYKSIVDSYPNSFYAPKSLYALAYIHIKELNDTSKAIYYLNLLKDNYKTSEIYFDAIEFLGDIKNAIKDTQKTNN